MNFLRAFLTCRSAATANHLSGWVGVAVAAGAGWLVSSGYLQQARDWVCTASPDDMGLAVAAIGAGASLLNTGTTKALAPKETPPDAIQPMDDYDIRKNAGSGTGKQ